VSFISCDEASNLADVTFSTELSKTLPVSVVNTDENSYMVLLDATSDSEIDTYADKIKSFDINKLYIAIENYSAPDDDEYYFNGTLGFSSKSETSASATCNISPLNITHVENTGQFEINNCNDILADVSSMLLDENAVKIYLDGSFTKAPFQFDLVVTVELSVTANPL
jgi:hypothetical protein